MAARHSVADHHPAGVVLASLNATSRVSPTNAACSAMQAALVFASLETGNAPPSRGFVFGRPGAPVSLFSVSSPIGERNGAPGGATERVRLRQAGLAIG